MRSAGLVVIAALTIAGQAEAQSGDCRKIAVYPARCFSMSKPDRRCPAIPAERAPCFAVHARLTFANGAPAARLLPAHSRRILGVVGGDGDAAAADLLPAAVEAVAKPPTPGSYRDVDGDFRVCPLATERAGWMRPVCIASASRLSLAPPR
jgi:hypothetical protein